MGVLAPFTVDQAAVRCSCGRRYSHALDLGDTAAWAEVFTDDGVMEMVAQGYEITGEALRSLPAGNGDPSGPQSRHIPTTFVIDGAGDEATMRSDVTVVGVGDGAEHARLHERRRGARHDGPGRTDTLPPECPPVACHSVSAPDEDGIDGRGPARWKVASECSSRNQDETYDSIRRRVERTDPKEEGRHHAGQPGGDTKSARHTYRGED